MRSGRLGVHTVNQHGQRVLAMIVLVWPANQPAPTAIEYGGGPLPGGNYVVAAYDPIHGGAVRRVRVRPGRAISVQLRLDPRIGGPRHPN